jgi:hypothetical protein
MQIRELDKLNRLYIVKGIRIIRRNWLRLLVYWILGVIIIIIIIIIIIWIIIMVMVIVMQIITIIHTIITIPTTRISHITNTLQPA